MSTLDEQIDGSHYKHFPIQPIEFVYRNNIPAIEASAIKYICRHRKKGGQKDLEKAIHMLQILIDLEYLV